MDGRPSTRPAAEGLAEDEVQLRGEEVHRLVEHGIREDVIALAEAGDAADVALGPAGDFFEDLDEEGVREESHAVGADAEPPGSLAVGDDGHGVLDEERPGVL